MTSPANSPEISRSEVSLFRLYTLRAAYLVMAGGLAAFVWPAVLHHSSEFAITAGVRVALLAGLGATAALGLRYPVQMLPILLFELTWKAIYLIAFAWPLWSGPSDHCRGGGRYKGCSVGGYSYPPDPLALCVRAVRAEARRSVEIGGGHKHTAPVESKVEAPSALLNRHGEVRALPAILLGPEKREGRLQLRPVATQLAGRGCRCRDRCRGCRCRAQSASRPCSNGPGQASTARCAASYCGDAARLVVKPPAEDLADMFIN